MRYIFQEVGIKQQAHIMGGLFLEYSMGGCVCVRKQYLALNQRIVDKCHAVNLYIIIEIRIKPNQCVRKWHLIKENNHYEVYDHAWRIQALMS